MRQKLGLTQPAGSHKPAHRAPRQQELPIMEIVWPIVAFAFGVAATLIVQKMLGK